MTSTPRELPPQLTQEERDTAVRRLQDAFAEGHLTHEEMDQGLTTALAARTRGELAPVLERLPAGPADTSLEITARNGRISRGAGWRAPRTLRITSEYGSVELDLARAAVGHPVIDIELQLDYGSAKLLLPRDATVDIDGLACEWKQPVHKVPRRGGSAGGLQVRLTGRMGFGRLKIRHQR
ncbi:DUF1707 domain-containing protein [Streptomyces sp. NBC_00433]